MKQHGLYRPENIRRLWWAGGVILVLTVLAQLFVPLHGYFRIDSIFGFHAAYGYLACVLMVLFARLLGLLIKRPDDYYHDD